MVRGLLVIVSLGSMVPTMMVLGSTFAGDSLLVAWVSLLRSDGRVWVISMRAARSGLVSVRIVFVQMVCRWLSLDSGLR